MSDLDRTLDLLHGQVNLGVAGAKERLEALQASISPPPRGGSDDGDYRSAVTGRFVTEEFAEDNEDTTVFEEDDDEDGFFDVDDLLEDED